jgi:hypothetical protein
MVPLTHSLEPVLSFSRNKIQLQKLFHEISRVAEKCLHEASNYGEVSCTWCTVIVVVAWLVSGWFCCGYCRVEMPIVSRKTPARFRGRTVQVIFSDAFFKIYCSG